MSKITIDAGHGGKDSGAVGPTGLRESGVNLEVCKQLNQLLSSRYRIQMIRSTDIFVEIGERSRLANNWHANYFISIHCNSDGPTANGIETLYRSSAAKELADPIQKALIADTKETDRGLKIRTNLGVLNATQMPAVLIEIGFISNKATEDKLRQPSYLNTIAQAIVAGIVAYLGDAAISPAPPAVAKPRVDITIRTDANVFVNGKPI